MLKINFPHIPRKISATLSWYTEKIGLWSLFSALILVNLYAKANLSHDYWDKATLAMQNPLSIDKHVNLAVSLRALGYSTRAENELTYASSLKSNLVPNSWVLGASTVDPDIILNNWQHERSNLEGQLNYWQNIVAQKPDYRDAYLELASLSYQLSRFSEAKNYLNQAVALDPNGTTVNKLSEVLKGTP